MSLVNRDSYPAELLDKIARYLSIEDLVLFALISRQCAQIARPLLFENVVLEPEWTRVELFATALRKNPHLSGLVKILRLNLVGRRFGLPDGRVGTESPSPQQHEDLDYILSSLSPNLRQLHFGQNDRQSQTFCSDPAFAGMEKHLATLTAPGLDTLIFEKIALNEGMDLSKTLQGRDLEFIHIGGGPFQWRVDEPGFEKRLERVESLTLNSNCGYFEEALTDALSIPEFHEGLKLKNLSFDGYCDEVMIDSLLSTNRDSLESLSWISFSIPADMVFEDFRFDLLCFKSLEHFYLHVVIGSDADESLLDLNRLLFPHHQGSSPSHTPASKLRTIAIAAQYDFAPEDSVSKYGSQICRILDDTFASPLFPNIESVFVEFQCAKPDRLSPETKAGFRRLAELRASKLHKSGKLRIAFRSLPSSGLNRFGSLLPG